MGHMVLVGLSKRQKYQTATEMCEFYPFWITQPGLGNIPRRCNITLPKCLISNEFIESYGKIENFPLVEGSCLSGKRLIDTEEKD